ncbi:hypothetical protein [Paenibacillus sp. L3-i20]|uniref:hypothetical protein n=1 Tax=Paenibacillus sp. L3-i20 TaxID=2905833 RepID=UPI001EE09BE0|nr:hypothetical protein [Paenibacillus sp. L3-i20]GKU76481.1 hypothetical protein L3i20_v208780 [Paenibacillus sp. L3-i20]
MFSNVEFSVDSMSILTILSILSSWGLIIYFVTKQYLKLEKRPVVWKMILATFIGLFAVTNPLTVFETYVKLAILPLGVWILYFYLRHRHTSWQQYRTFAWIGFWSNYISLVVTLLFSFLQNSIYPESEASSYIANVNHAAIVAIHPSASVAKLDRNKLLNQLEQVQPDVNTVDAWYIGSKLESETYFQHERFPYLIIGVKSKWGSGLEAAIYIQDDGKGLYIAGRDRHYYFRSEQPLIEVEVRNS